jgi:hypothetical protein
MAFELGEQDIRGQGREIAAGLELASGTGERKDF